MLLLTFKFLKGQKRRFLTFRGNLRDYESIWDCLKSNSDRNSWTCKCYTALLPSWGENWENCTRNIFPKIVREKYSPNSSFRKSFAHFVVGGSVLSTGSKYLETANMSRTNKDCAAKNSELITLHLRICDIFFKIVWWKLGGDFVWNMLKQFQFFWCTGQICIILSRVKGQPSNWDQIFNLMLNQTSNWNFKLSS